MRIYRYAPLKKMLAIFSFAALLFGMNAAEAMARPSLTLTLTAKLVKHTAHGDILIPVGQTTVHSGQIVKYSVVARNIGDSAAYKFVPAATVNNRMTVDSVMLGGAGRCEGSLDHRKTWVTLRPGPHTKYTDIRWIFLKPIAAHSTTTFGYSLRAR